MSDYLYKEYLKIVDKKTSDFEQEMIDNDVRNWLKQPMTKTFFNYIFCKSQEFKEIVCFRTEHDEAMKFVGAYQFATELLDKLKEFK